jgi:two-component system OmpR family sensor kinase
MTRLSRQSIASAGRRLPLRVRLVAGFVLAMTVLLFGTGVFVYWRVRIDLDTALDRDLSDARTAVEPLIGANGVVAEPTTPGPTAAERLHQVLSSTGQVLSFGEGVGSAPLIKGDDVERAARRPIRVQVGGLLPASSRPLRLLASPVVGHSPAAVLVVAVQRDQRDEALRELLATLLIAGLGALVVAGLVGERLAKAALVPVERYRAQAATIAAGASGVRLDVPTSRDDEVTRLGHTFNDVLSALEHALERERRFVDDASHELRTPLTLLSSRVQLLRGRTRSVDEHEQALAELATDIDDLIELSDRLLDLGSSAAGSPFEHPAAVVDLRELTRAMGLDQLGIQVDIGPTPALASLTPAAFRQIVGNLVGNARTHGADPVAITVRVRADAVILSVSDTGAGMPLEFVPVAVERFRRGNEARGRPGTGLGLGLVDALIRRHDGELRICSAGAHHRVTKRFAFPCAHVEQGTTITVALPRAPGL